MPLFPSLPDPAHLSDLYTRFSHNVAPLMEYTDGVLRAEGELDIATRELIAAYVSALNACDFCFQSHLAYAQAFGIAGHIVEGLLTDIDSADIAPALRPIFHYVKKLNTLPSRIVEQDARRVLDAGWSEKALYEAVQVCALFNMMNRIVEGCGVNFDYSGQPEKHPATGQSPQQMQHSYADYGRRVEAARRQMATDAGQAGEKKL
ncbi:MAG TPA: peroxidase [Devosia sp.]|nr:peroxidase [Devosia sp.]